jgi:hypothetical protein
MYETSVATFKRSDGTEDSLLRTSPLSGEGNPFDLGVCEHTLDPLAQALFCDRATTTMLLDVNAIASGVRGVTWVSPAAAASGSAKKYASSSASPIRYDAGGTLGNGLPAGRGTGAGLKPSACSKCRAAPAPTATGCAGRTR